MSLQNLQVTLRDLSGVALSADSFSVDAVPCPEPADGQVLVRCHWLSLDPYMLAQINGRHVTGNLQPGDLLNGEVIGEVVASRSPRWREGARVRGMLGWRTFAVVDSQALSAVADTVLEPRWCLSMLGMPGLTAYAGLHWQAGLAAGETVVVPAASGAVGSMVVQLALKAGCRVVGIVGSQEKSRYVTDILGAQACIVRDEEPLADGLDRCCQSGIDIYYDLVGGHFLEQASARLALGARIILAGVQKSSMAEPLSPVLPAHWIKSRARVHGLVVYDHEHRRDEFLDYCVPLANGGELTVREELVEGLLNAPAALLRIQASGHTGKVVVKL